MDFDYLLSRALTQRLQVLEEGLTRGAPNDYPEYCKLVGEIQGIRYALHALSTVRSQVRADEDAA